MAPRVAVLDGRQANGQLFNLVQLVHFYRQINLVGFSALGAETICFADLGLNMPLVLL